MTLVIADISMSLDGYVTGPGPSVASGLGEGGEAIHAWAMEPGPEERAVLDATAARTGAILMGRRTFDFVDGPNGWNQELGYGAERDQSDAPPAFVVTSTKPEKVRLAHQFTVVTEGLAAAVDRAVRAAGDKDVVVMGGGALVRGVVTEGLADQITLHVTPVIMGGGTPLFAPGARVPLEILDVVSTPRATHLTYAVDHPSTS